MTMTDDDRIDVLVTALQRIESWAEAYPTDIFPAPDLKLARELLAAGGMTLDAVSADIMRHALKGIGKICREALEEPT